MLHYFFGRHPARYCPQLCFIDDICVSHIRMAAFLALKEVWVYGS